jgi:serine/threonine protein kinase
MHAQPARSIGFGDFELDVRAGELRKHGLRIRFQDQSFQILLMLLERPGEVVLREEIRQTLWPNNTIVEFDHSINAAIKRLRNALGESAEEPRFIETLAKRGYRFAGTLRQGKAERLPVAAVTDADDLSGKTFSHFRVLEKLGSGGMGVVYRADDLKLGRQVALKFLQLPADELPGSVLERFEREARAASALNHPNICTVHSTENFGGQPVIVMELLDGETLEARLARGPLPREEAVALAIQIAGALAEAHRKGIVHRDMKPANVMLTKSGVKVLDFGLAKIEKPGDESARQPGVVMGTLRYMSPEQAQGKVTDARSDIFSFGAVLYEMVSGRRAFEISAAILESDPPSVEPEGLNRVVRACLAKDPTDRFQSARDVQRALEWSASTSVESNSGAARRWLPPWAVGAVLAVIALLAWLRTSHPESNVPGDMTFSVLPPGGKALAPVGTLGVDRISPDGSKILFRATRNEYYIRRLNSLESEPLTKWIWSGDAFWTPDSQSITFSADHGRLMKMRTPKGAQDLIGTSPGALRGGTWGDKGTIIFAALNIGLFSVPAAGGAAQRLEVPGLKEGRYNNPDFLPGGEDFLFTFAPPDSEAAQIYLATLRGGRIVETQLLLTNDTSAAFTPAGGRRILFVRSDNLYSQKLDRKARQLSGDPELVQERVASYVDVRLAYFSVSRDGSIAWRSGTAVVAQATVFDRKGNRIGVAGAPAPITTIVLSPDESRLVAHGDTGTWLIDANGPGRVPLKLGVNQSPVWSPDGARLIFIAGNKVCELPMGGTSQISELGELPASENFLGGISADGQRILYHDGSSALFLSALRELGKPQRVTAQRADNAALSPDGTWAVYGDRTGSGVYAQPVSGTSPPRQIGDGYFPVWRADGKEILYYDRNRTGGIYSVRVDGSSRNLRFAAPEVLFFPASPMGLAAAAQPLAVNHDGSRIYFLQSKEQPDSGVIQVRTGAIR